MVASPLFAVSCTQPGEVLEDAHPSFLGLIQDSRIAGCVAVQTQIPSVRTTYPVSDLNENHPRAIVNQQASILSPTAVPSRVADFLILTYTSLIIHSCPILCEDEAKGAFDAVLASVFNPACDARNMYIVSLIMAISLSTAARNKLARAQSLATALFKNAMLHLSTVLTNDLQGLQALLLLIHYTFLNPTVGNLWLLTGISSEACIELGLHQEVQPGSGLSPLDLDKRRRIFWCAWEMEIGVSAALRRPIRTLSKHISVSFPRPTPILLPIATLIWRYRQLEAELVSILHGDEPIPARFSSLEAWMADMETKVVEWTHELQQSVAANECSSPAQPQWREMALYGDIAYPYCLLLLYGPSNRVKTPTTPDLLRAFRASIQVAVNYWEQSNSEFGRIKYTFHTCYHTFAAALVFLRHYTYDKVQECAQCFARILSSIGERWPAAARCLDEYNLLLEPIMKSYSDTLLQQQGFPDPFLTEGCFGEPFDVVDYENFIHIFNPPHGVADNPLFSSPTSIPSDWDTEFQFGINLGSMDGL
ncbi:hypothetical protein BJX61DRAFT_553141 [Aspergillus egyptiacus]|nr:hypothetical protein BJX61DRAFT_553141 [Aspergillus egyptiacus]